MSNFYKIEGENEFAYFRADFRQILQIFQSDPKWTKNFVELNNDIYGKVVRFDYVSNLAGTKLIEQGNSHFVIRGGQYFFYRVEAVDAGTSRIVPERRLWAYWKFAVPFGLFLCASFPSFLRLSFSVLNRIRH
ncbi:MAG: hypothetical protein KIS76_07155 [Pyrinomonadaceae bacterium]|nr:hypothetical protein [Pyrinomonadaceae bacterium]